MLFLLEDACFGSWIDFQARSWLGLLGRLGLNHSSAMMGAYSDCRFLQISLYSLASIMCAGREAICTILAHEWDPKTLAYPYQRTFPSHNCQGHRYRENMKRLYLISSDGVLNLW
jgi:hypothetical protein